MEKGGHHVDAPLVSRARQAVASLASFFHDAALCISLSFTLRTYISSRVSMGRLTGQVSRISPQTMPMTWCTVGLTPLARVDKDLNSIKGGGACQLPEKVLAEAADTYV